MDNDFEGKSKAWLLEQRSALQEILVSPAGSQTHVGIQQGVFHEFGEISRTEMRKILTSIRYALFCLEPDTYPDPRQGRVMKITTVYS